MGAIRSQTTTWIRFRKYDKLVELAFNDGMVNVHNLSDMNEIVSKMIAHMNHQIENPAISKSRFVFGEVLHMDVDFHQLNLTRGSSYLKLSTRLYDKRDDFDFHIVYFPYLSSNIPSGPSYGMYISELIRYA